MAKATATDETKTPEKFKVTEPTNYFEVATKFGYGNAWELAALNGVHNSHYDLYPGDIVQLFPQHDSRAVQPDILNGRSLTVEAEAKGGPKAKAKLIAEAGKDAEVKAKAEQKAKAAPKAKTPTKGAPKGGTPLTPSELEDAGIPRGFHQLSDNDQDTIEDVLQTKANEELRPGAIENGTHVVAPKAPAE